MDYMESNENILFLNAFIELWAQIPGTNDTMLYTVPQLKTEGMCGDFADRTLERGGTVHDWASVEQSQDIHVEEVFHWEILRQGIQ